MFRVDKTIKEENVKSAGKDIIHRSSSVNNRKILLIFPTFEEFYYEKFEFIKNCIQDIQICGAGLGVDIEWYTFSGNYDDFVNYDLLLQLLSEEHTIVICFIGNKVGYYMPPLEIDSNTFDALRQKLFEMSTDVKLLDKLYILKESKKGKKYCLQKNFLEDVLVMEKLIEMFKKMGNEDNKLLKLYINHVAEIMMSQQNANHIFVQRRFKGMPLEENNTIFSETTPTEYECIEGLKNTISQKCHENNVFSFILQCTSKDFQDWTTTKEGENYGKCIIEKISERIKQLIDNNCTIHLPTPISHSGCVDMFDIAKREQVTHQQYYIHSKPTKWAMKRDIESVNEKILNMTIEGKWCVTLNGDIGIGKTSQLLLLHETLQNNTNYISFIRFVGLTSHSIYDHEIWRNILFLLEDCSNSTKINTTLFDDSLDVSKILKSIQNLAKKIDKKIYILFDNVHLMKSSKNINENFKFTKQISNLFIVSTMLENTQCNYMMSNDTITLKKPTIDESIEIIKSNASKSKIGNECLTNLRLYLTEHNENLAGALVVAQLLSYNIPVELSKSSVMNLVSHLENYYGETFIKKLIRYFVASPFGFTSMEMTTLLNFATKPLSYSQDEFPDLNISKGILSILTKYNMLFDCVVMDNQVVYKLKHSIFKRQFAENYLYDIGCNIKEANQMTYIEMASIYFDTSNYEDNEEVVFNGYMFPQPLIRENGNINLRKVSYQWKYLLEGGNAQNLKEFTLCNFEYIEALMRANGLGYLISVFDETCETLLDHDLLVFYLQVLIPSIDTLLRDSSQIAPECIGRLRYTRESNSQSLNGIVEQAMSWVDMYDSSPLLVPLTCWISPPKMDEILKVALPNWSGKSMIVSPTINYQNILLSGNSEDPSMIYLYHVPSQSIETTFYGHSKKVTSLSVASNGVNFASSSFDGTIKIWDIHNIDNVKTFEITKAKVNCCLYSHNSKFIASGTSDSIANVIDVDSGEIIATFPEHTGSVICLQLTSNDEFLIVGSGDFAVMVYSIEEKCLISKLEGLMAPVTCMALTTNDAFVVVACEDETVRVYSLISSQELHELSGHDCRVSSIAVSSDDCQIFVGVNSKIVCYDLHNSQIIDTLKCGEKFPIGSIQRTFDNSFIVAGCGKELHMWNIQCGNIKNNAVCEIVEDNSICYVKMSPDEKSTCCGSVSGVIALWDLEVCQCVWTQTHKLGSPVTSIGFTDDSFYLISGCSEGQICLWEADKGQLIKNIKIHSLPITTLYFIGGSTQTYKVFSCDKGNNSHIWNLTPLDDSPNFYTVNISFGDVDSPILFKKHHKLILGEFSKNRHEIQIYHVYDSSVNLKAKAYHSEIITCYNFDRHERILVTGSKDQSLKIWQLDNGYLTQVLVGHESAVTCCAVCDKGNIVVSNSSDQRLIIWDAETGTVKSSIQTCHVVNIVEITADGLVIITADTNGWIEAWSSTYGVILSSFNTYNTISSLVISIDSNRIVCPLVGIPQLPILCLHNTPAGIIQRHMSINEKSLHRINSAASYTSTSSDSRPRTSIKQSPPKLENSKCSEEDLKNDSTKTTSQSLIVATSKPINKDKNYGSQENLKMGGENVRFRDNASVVSNARVSNAVNTKTGGNGEQLKSSLCNML